ncbi:MAG: bifunctional nuclease family protein [Planctomycetota bacterium]|nr:MAG: bifunctional nuclease family protein [Planctomycetota bacterium]
MNMEEGKIEARLSRLVVVDGHDQQFIQLREAHPRGGKAREITMVIGLNEAAEIRRCLQNESMPRPLTHELAYRILGQLGGRLQEAVIHDLREGTYYAELRLEHQGTVLHVDCRPSDGIALSLRNRSPIYILEKVFAAASRED